MTSRELRQRSQSPSVTMTEPNLRKRKESREQYSSRPKRARYTPIACNGCKQRKVKCDGHVPCRRCDDLSTACIYQNDRLNISQDSEQLQHMKSQIHSMEEKLDYLLRTVSKNTSSVLPMNLALDYSVPANLTATTFQPTASNLSRSESNQMQTQCFGYRGHTSSIFVFNVASDGMRSMGIDPGLSRLDMVTPSECAGPPGLESHSNFSYPFGEINREEALRLYHIYTEGVGTMYPILNMESVLAYLELLFADNSFERGELRHSTPSRLCPRDYREASVLNLVLAISLTSENGGKTPKAEQLFNSVISECDGTLCDLVGIRGIQILTLMALYHAHLDEDIRACRIAGLASRLCFETGLHRRDVLVRTFPDEQDQLLAARIFWSVYTLDRRASLGAGIPFVMQDVEIDPSLPEPDPAYPYLSLVVGFARISSKAWNVTNSFGEPTTDLKLDEIAYLNFQLSQWQKRIPESLSYDPLEPTCDLPRSGQASLYIRAILYLRTNQLRNILYRRVLDTPARINANLEHARSVVEVAKDTIRMLSILHKATSVYQSHFIIFNHFLLSALGVLLLAVTNAPTVFGQTVFKEYYVALELIRGLCSSSRIVLQLWKTVEILSDLGPKLGLTPKALPEATRSHTLLNNTFNSKEPLHRAMPALNESHIRDNFENPLEARMEGNGFSLSSTDFENLTDLFPGQAHDMYNGIHFDDPWMSLHT